MSHLVNCKSMFYTEGTHMADRYGDDLVSPVHDMARNAGDDGRDDDWDHDYDGGLLVEEEKPKLQPPKQYKVIVINDDYTPMEFVVQVLETFFNMDRETATRVMLTVHTKGKGVCGVFTYEIAETKVAQVMGIAKQHQHPLQIHIHYAEIPG